MKKFLKGCLAAALSLSSLVTSSITTPVFAEEEPVEISLMIPDWGVPTDDMLKDFQEKTNIKVNVIPTAWDDIRDKVATASVGKKAAADVIEVDWSWTGEFVSANWLAPIEIDEDTLKAKLGNI